MAPRKRKAPSPATAASAKEIRDKRARQRVSRDSSSFDRLTELNSIDSPLLRLPAELRSMIFTYVFRGQYYLFLERDDHTVTCGETFTQMNMSLLLVSRQTYAETGMLPYELGTFDFQFHPGYVHRVCEPFVRGFLKKRSMQQVEAIVCLQAREPRGRSWRWYWGGTGLVWTKRLDV